MVDTIWLHRNRLHMRQGLFLYSLFIDSGLFSHFCLSFFFFIHGELFRVNTCFLSFQNTQYRIHIDSSIHLYTIYIYIYIILCWRSFEYNYCIPCRKVGPPLRKSRVHGMTLNYDLWWDSSSGCLGSVEYPFISITPSSTRSGSTCLDHIYGLFGLVSLFNGISTFVVYSMSKLSL